MTAISVFTPKFSVVLRKLVGRRDTASVRYQSAAREIDITSLLGDSGTIRTHKGIGEPCGGFTLTVADRMGSSASDTLAALVEPMDLIEIRGARRPHLYVGRTMPLIMRGFVSQVSRSSGMAPDGGPQRTVSIAGQELGRLWLVHSIFWQVAALTDIPYLDAYRAQVSIGMSATYQPLAEFVTTLTEKVINQKIRSLAAFSDAKVKPFAVDATVKRGVVSPTRVAPFQGPIWGLAEQFVDRPWNEMWCEDRGDPGQEVPTLVLREAPFRDATTGKLLLSGAVVPEAFAVESQRIVTIALGRSDSRVANFFWVPPGAALLDQNTYVNVVALQRGDPLDLNHQNNLPDLYGLRRMEVVTSLLPDSITSHPSDLPAEQQGQAADQTILWHQQRMADLKAMNRDNTVFEEGEMTVQGDETIRPGREVIVTQGALRWSAYVPTVSHTIAPMTDWTTTLRLERGTGFLARLRYEGSPYIAEGIPGAYA